MLAAQTMASLSRFFYALIHIANTGSMALVYDHYSYTSTPFAAA
jgi:hypothetical protein